MLDDNNLLTQRDSQDALGVAARLYTQASYGVELNFPEHDGREIRRIIVAGMGGSALAADVVKVLLRNELPVPFEVVKDYTLPNYVDHHTLVIASSHSGNTEETLSCLDQATERGAQLAIIATGGSLETIANERTIMFASFPRDTQPRMGMIYNLRALLKILAEYGLVSEQYYQEMTQASEWLRQESENWAKETTVDRNYAKQLALLAVGKTPVFYGGALTAPVAYKWKISWNENAKNVSVWSQYPEFNHNEFLGWTSHPIEKPFVVFDLISNLEHARILKRFALSDQLLSGRRPKAIQIHLKGDTYLQQVLWGSILADFASIYVAILNGVDPTQVDLIEKFKKELTSE